MPTHRLPNPPLALYEEKRDFARTPEPRGDVPAKRAGDALAFVVQKHAATRLHYDLRLELDGVMLSWAVPRGPSYDPADKRMAVRTEDHPLSYNTFEGTIPKGLYGAGTVIVWDRGIWKPVGDPRAGLEAGKLVFTLAGQKLAGMWELVRIAKKGEEKQGQVPWLLFKKRDAFVRPKAEYDVIAALPDSVVAKPLSPLVPATSGGSVSPAPGATGKAVKAPLPERIGPQLATLATGVPPTGDWRYEIKLDGYRLMARIDAKDERGPRLITRGGHDWTSKMLPLAEALAAWKLDSAWIDGEIVVLNDEGLPDFGLLQNAIDRRAESKRIVYFVFDLPYLDGVDLRALPLAERRQRLVDLVERRAGANGAGGASGAGAGTVRLSADFQADATTIVESARRMKLEGLIAKRADAPYVSARTDTWLKIKCRRRQEFVVGGFTDRDEQARGDEVGSLQLGVYEDDRLVSVGGVGTGWDARTAAGLKKRLLPLETKISPFAAPAAEGGAKRSRWSRKPASADRHVKPELVIEASFTDWTADGQVRHAKFEGLRADKPAREVVREEAVAPAFAGAPAPLRTKVSHPERVIDKSTGLTKLDLVRYYESVGAWMLPHLVGRPCSFVRGPDGIGGELFFQKHAERMRFPGVKDLDAALFPGHAPLLEVPSARALAEAAQMNVIEFHTWNATARAIGKPDRVVFDLDPGEGVTWKAVQEAALLVRSLLSDLGLESWIKTSGGKGLHVVVPIAPRLDTAAVKSFAQSLVQHIARVIPNRFVAKSGGSNRVGRIFVDYLRNNWGATTAAAFSARSRPGLGVSMPLEWDALPGIKSGAMWTIATAREHLSFQTADPWAGYWKSRQTLTKAVKALGPPTG